MTKSLLQYSKVTIRYREGARPVVEDATFELLEGQRLAVIGLNGSGKTTLLMSAVGLLPFSGKISVCQTPLTAKKLPAIREKVGFLFNVPEDQLLFPTPLRDVAFSLSRLGLQPKPAKERALEALQRMGVAEFAEHPIEQLSHGQKQRVALAGALAPAPPLLLLDEPSSGLDPVGRRQLADILSDLEAGMLIATHDLEFAENVCHGFLLIENGRLEFGLSSAAEVRQRWL